MTYIENWEEFSKAAERLYLQNPWKVTPLVCTDYGKFLITALVRNAGSPSGEIPSL